MVDGSKWNFIGLRVDGFYLSLLVLCGVGYYIYRNSCYWLPWYFIRKFKRLYEDESFEKAYVVLLKQYERIGFERKEDQTLGNMLKFIDDYFSTIQMTELTSQYEKYVYGNQLKKGTWNRLGNCGKI